VCCGGVWLVVVFVCCGMECVGWGVVVVVCGGVGVFWVCRVWWGGEGVVWWVWDVGEGGGGGVVGYVEQVRMWWLRVCVCVHVSVFNLNNDDNNN